MPDTTRRLKRLRAVECQTNRLYGPLPGAIAYLQEVQAQYGGKQDLALEEHWTGHEDMEMRFTYLDDETDDEMHGRIKSERLANMRAARDNRQAAERKVKLAELERLKRELGV